VKYFTPGLLAECRSLDSDIAEKAAAKWQKRAAAYRKRLQDIQHEFPPGVRHLVRSFTLHDAYLLTINLAEVRGRPDPNLFLSFRLADRDGRAGIQLRYDAVKQLKPFYANETPGKTEMFALYDEFDVSGGTVTHSILMTAGVEIRVRFANLHVTSFTRVAAQGQGESDIKVKLLEMVVS
jgi:hypothetical protein